MYSRGCKATSEAQRGMLRVWVPSLGGGRLCSSKWIDLWPMAEIKCCQRNFLHEAVDGDWLFSERYVWLLFASMRQQLFEWFRNPTRTPNRRVAHRLDVLNRSCTYIQLGMCLMPFATSA